MVGLDNYFVSENWKSAIFMFRCDLFVADKNWVNCEKKADSREEISLNEAIWQDTLFLHAL